VATRNQQKQGFGMPHPQGLENLRGVNNYPHAPSSNVAAAEMRLRGIVDPRVEEPVVPSRAASSSIMCGLPVVEHKSGLDVLAAASSSRKSPKSRFLYRAAASVEETPKAAAAAPYNGDHQDDANRRLMERLELLSSASAVTAIPGSVRDSAQGAFRPISFEQRAASSARERELSELDILQRNVMFQARRRASLGMPPSSNSGLSSLMGTTSSHSSSSYHNSLPPQRSGSLPSSLPSRAMDIRSVTKALEDAQRLEELAQSQRENARAMARAMVQHGSAGYDDILPFGRY
jgi:hypothetical protein